MKNNQVSLFGNGKIPHFYKDYLSNYKLIAVDGGLNFLHKEGVSADILVGDLDSVDREILEDVKSNMSVMHIKEQDSTDFEKALYSIQSDMYLCFGFWGASIDHSLGALHVLGKYSDKKIIIFSEENCMFLMPEKGAIDAPKGVTISIYPLTPTSFVCSNGLEYPLNDLILGEGIIGTRNKTVSNGFSWEYCNGKSVCIVPAEHRKLVIDFLNKVSV